MGNPPVRSKRPRKLGSVAFTHHASPITRHVRAAGFTLVEIIIVIALLGLVLSLLPHHRRLLWCHLTPVLPLQHLVLCVLD